MSDSRMWPYFSMMGNSRRLGELISSPPIVPPWPLASQHLHRQHNQGGLPTNLQAGWCPPQTVDFSSQAEIFSSSLIKVAFCSNDFLIIFFF